MKTFILQIFLFSHLIVHPGTRINLQLSIDPYHDIISVYSDLAVRKNEPKLPNSEH
jgi:hypothetical protein